MTQVGSALHSQTLALLIAAALALAGCEGAPAAPPWGHFGGDAARGRLTISRDGCGSCHEIPGVADAHGLAGPPLDHFAQRTIVAGLLPNTPENLVRWVRQPQTIVPNNAMPDTGLSDAQARDVAAYLYTLQ